MLLNNKTHSYLSLDSSVFLICLTLIAVLSFSPSTHSEENIENAITVEADKAEINAKTGTIIYQGNVIVKHPKIKIIGESVELIDDGNKRYFFTSGSPSRVFWQHEKGTSIGSAQTIAFKESATKKTISMKGNALVNHQGNQVQGHWIVYDFLTGQLNVSSKSSGNTSKKDQQSKKKERIKIILKQKQ